jgi:hypothetical protein
VENPPPERNLGLKRIQMDAILKKCPVKVNNLKINVIRKYFELQIFHPNHQQSREAIPLNKYNIIET